MDKTMFAEIDGVKIPRPQNQDKPVKAFGAMAPTTRIASTEPTKRFILWFISNYRYAFNIFFLSDFLNWMTGRKDGVNPVLQKYLIVLKELMDSNYVKYGDKQRLTLKVTPKGQMYRITSNPGFKIYALLFSAIVAFTIFILNQKTSSKEEEILDKSKATQKSADSVQNSRLQTVDGKEKDSSSLR